jgi:hypothetical protein
MHVHGDNGRVITDEEREEFRKLRGQAADSLRAMIFRDGVKLSRSGIDARALEVSILVNELFRELIPDGIRWQWSVTGAEARE